MNQMKPSEYLAGLNIDKMRFGLKAIKSLLSLSGNPQKSYKTINIAGTNGKGSTAAMISSILQSAGYKVGLYTSPHLIDVRERIVVNSKKISLRDFNRIITYVKYKTTQPLTYFEFLTAAAFIYFQEQKIDIAVLETGLGGRLDATNVCRPLVSVITNVDFDHMAYLGDTLEDIAREKAGIIKQNGICVTAAKQKQVLKVLKEICLRRRAKLYSFNRDIKITKLKSGLISYYGLYRDIKKLAIPLIGEHQLSNAALALAAVEVGSKKGFPAGDQAINAGLKKTHWEARLEILCTNPLFILDGAHNPAGIDALIKSLKEDFSFRRLILIFGALADKDYRRMLYKIIPQARLIILTQPQTKRAVPVHELAREVRKMNRRLMVTQNVREAIEQSFALAGERDLILAAGSLYLAGEVKQAFPKSILCAKRRKRRKTQ